MKKKKKMAPSYSECTLTLADARDTNSVKDDGGLMCRSVSSARVLDIMEGAVSSRWNGSAVRICDAF